MPQVLRTLVRLSVGLLGCAWFFGGIYGVVYAGLDHEWAIVLGCAFTMLLGFCVAYWAFIRAPWEREPTDSERAT